MARQWTEASDKRQVKSSLLWRQEPSLCMLPGRKILSLQPPANAGSLLADFSTLKMEAIRSAETSVHTRSTRRHIPEDGILHSHRCENLKSYKSLKIQNFFSALRNADNSRQSAFKGLPILINMLCLRKGRLYFRHTRSSNINEQYATH
jgi:hypothetical protein